MSSFYANYGFHPQTEWMKEREAQNPGVGLYAHWMQVTHQHARKALEQTREEMSKYYDRKARQQPDIKVGDLVMLNAKNIRTKQPTKKLSPRMHGPFKVLQVKKGERGFQTRNIAAVENPPNISCFVTGTLPSLGAGRKRTTSTSGGRDRRGPRMRGRKDREQ